MTSQPHQWSPHPPTHYQEPSAGSQGVENYLASQQQPHQAGYSQPQAGYSNQQQMGYNQQQPISGHTQSGQGYVPPSNPNTQTYAPNPNTQTYTPNPAYPQLRPPLPPPPPLGANRQMSLPNPSHGYNAHGHYTQQLTDTSVEALDLARLNAQRAQYPQTGYTGYGSNVQPQSAYGSQPQSGYGTPQGGYAYGQAQSGYASQPPAATYQTQPTTVNYQTPSTTYPSSYQTPPISNNYQSQPALTNYQSQPSSMNHQSQPVPTSYQSQPTSTNYQSQPAPTNYQSQPASNYNPQPPAGGGTANVGDFIDVGPFTYSGIRETSPPPRRQESPQRRESPQRPQRYESPQRVQRQESPQRVQRDETPQRVPRGESPQQPQTQSSLPRGHLPWAAENTDATDRDLGDPDLVYPSSPRQNNSNNPPVNVQLQSQSHESLSETDHSPEERNPNETSYFSPNPSNENKDKKDWGVREEGERAGDINVDGKLISNGPRKRMAVRALEVLCAIGAVVACIYAFAVPKPNPAAPPASQPAIYVTVVLGFLTILAFAYIYIIRGLFGVGVNKDDPYAHPMVLPISRHRPGRSNKLKSQVNLIAGSSTSLPKQDSNLTPGVPWSEQHTSGGVFTSYEREKARLSARKGLWWALGLDILGALTWGTAFVLAMVGTRCPVGGYSGWCDAFNGAVACSCIACVLFIVSGVFVGRDLVASRRSDRKLGKGY